MNTLPKCADPSCYMPAALTLAGVARCVAHHRDANGGRIA